MALPADVSDPFGATLVDLHKDTYPFISPDKGSPSRIKVLVTGTSKGIGRETVRSFARAGATAIALMARSNLDDVEKEVLKFQVDVTDKVGVEKAMKTVEKCYEPDQGCRMVLTTLTRKVWRG